MTSGPQDYWGICFPVVAAVLLLGAIDAKVSLVLKDVAERAPFLSVTPYGAQ